VADSLRDLRRRRALSQSELARRAGVTRAYVSLIENGRAVPAVAVANRLGAELGVTGARLHELAWRHRRARERVEGRVPEAMRELVASAGPGAGIRAARGIFDVISDLRREHPRAAAELAIELVDSLRELAEALAADAEAGP